MTRVDLARAIDRALAPLGFNRMGTRWYRSAEDVTEVVSMNVTKSADRVQVELGIFDPVAYRQVWHDVPATITDAECVVRCDLGRACGVLGVWNPDDADDGAAMANMLASCGVAWLRSMGSRHDRVAYLRDHGTIPSEIVLLAASEAALGEMGTALRRLEALRERVVGERWRERIDDLVGRLANEP